MARLVIVVMNVNRDSVAMATVRLMGMARKVTIAIRMNNAHEMPVSVPGGGDPMVSA